MPRKQGKKQRKHAKQVHATTVDDVETKEPETDLSNVADNATGSPAADVGPVEEDNPATHYGNGIPCRHYNHNGCKLGAKCNYSHATDDLKCVCDSTGRNVCRYFLLGICRFDDRCVYLHSKANLDKGGWWNDSKKVALMNKDRQALHMYNPRLAPRARYTKEVAERDEDELTFGFTKDDVMELYCQGVKPWDEDAGRVLAVLKGYY